MIIKDALVELLEKYRVDAEKVMSTNSHIFQYGNYVDIEKALKYLREELNISAANIEKCPSVLYIGVDNLRTNYDFLLSTNIGKRKIEGCLHVLYVEPQELRETYSYVLENYGEEILKSKTGILSFESSLIKLYEARLKDKLKKR